MEKLVNLRGRLKGVNLASVAKDVPCTRAYLSALRSGTRVNPTYQMVEKIETALAKYEAETSPNKWQKP